MADDVTPTPQPQPHMPPQPDSQPEPVRPLGIGSVIGRTFGIFFRNIVSFGIIAVLVYVPLVAFQLVTVDAAEQGYMKIAEFVLNLLLTSILTAALVYGTIMDMRQGRRMGVGETVGRGFALAIPVLLVTIVYSFLIGIGMILLIIPGLIVMTILFVCVPAAVVERNGVAASLSRSSALTRGNRWRVFGVIVILSLISIVLQFAVGAAVGAAQLGLVAAVIVLTVISAFSSILYSIGGAVTYHDLRIIKEGGDIDQIAAVFD